MPYPEYLSLNKLSVTNCFTVKIFRPLLFFFVLTGCNSTQPIGRTIYFPRQEIVASPPVNKQTVWVFLLAGQSNMAGRGLVEPQDTVPDKRLLTINKNGQLILAKEPLHFYEPTLTGLDCGYSFGKMLLQNIPDSIAVLLIPTAIGGSSISQWIGDSLYRNIKLFSNFREKVAIAKQYGVIKGILWHQGESDANKKNIPYYRERLGLLFSRFRSVIGDSNLPVMLGELGFFLKDEENRALINQAIRDYSSHDLNTTVIVTSDLQHKGDSLHFNSGAQRMMGRRFAETYLQKFR